MKRMIWMLMLVSVISTGSVFAAKLGKPDTDADGRISKEEFLANRKALAEKKGVQFNQPANERDFAKRDKNKDGFLDAAELGK